MKQCTVCFSQWEDNVKFCGKCGGALVSAQENTDSAQVNEQTVASDAVSPENSYIPQGFEPQQPKKKSFIKPLIIGGAALALVVAVVVTGFCTNWFGLGAPLNGLVKALDNTLNAESFTVKETYIYKYDDSEEKSVYEQRVVHDRDNEELSCIEEKDGGSSINCIYNDKYYYISDSYASVSDFDYDEFIDAHELVSARYGIGDDIDWGEVVASELSSGDFVVNKDTEEVVEDMMKNYYTDKEWLEEYLGFEKDGNEYSFNVDYKKYYKELKRIFLDSGLYSSKNEEIIEGYFDRIIKNVDDNQEYEITFTVESGYISRVEIYEKDDYNEATHIYEVSDVNETEISEKELKEIKNKVEDNTCEECGYYSNGDGDYHGDCDSCGDHVESLTHKDGSLYCDDCINSSQCEMCGEYSVTMYTYAGLDMCWDCYSYYKYD